MINNSKRSLNEHSINYKALSNLLNISERQAQNIMTQIPKTLYNYLVISYITEKHVEDLFQLDTKEIENIKKRLNLISNLEKFNFL
jgi:hypothetical protein